MTVRLRYAAKSDVGLLREGNEDSAYAGPHLLAVADGMGGHAHGEVASAGAIATLAPLDEGGPTEDLAGALEQAVRQANDELRRMVETDPTLDGMGTTLTAMLWQGERAALVHVGDSRAYLLRDGQLYRITRDHTLVQSLIDEGRIDEEEAAVHPQRSLLLRALDGRSEVEPDVVMHEAHAGDRYLLCSDGLSSVVSEDTLTEALRAGWDPDRVVQQLIELANRGGGPDNITCVVADVVETLDEALPPAVVAGAAAQTMEQADTVSLDTSAGRAAALMRPAGADAEEEHEEETAGPVRRRRWPRIFLSLLVVVAALGATSYGVWHYARSQYYIGARDGEVVIFRGLSQQVAGRHLSQVERRTGLALHDLPEYKRTVVSNNIPAQSLDSAQDVVEQLRVEAQCSQQQARPDPSTTEPRSQQDKKSGKQPGGKSSGPSGQQSATADPPDQSGPSPDHCTEEVSATRG